MKKGKDHITRISDKNEMNYLRLLHDATAKNKLMDIDNKLHGYQSILDKFKDLGNKSSLTKKEEKELLSYADKLENIESNNPHEQLLLDINQLEKTFELPIGYVANKMFPQLCVIPPSGKVRSFDRVIQNEAHALFSKLDKVHKANPLPVKDLYWEWDKEPVKADVVEKYPLEKYKYRGQRFVTMVIRVDVTQNLEEVLLPLFKEIIKNRRNKFYNFPQSRVSGKELSQIEDFLEVQKELGKGTPLEEALFQIGKNKYPAKGTEIHPLETCVQRVVESCLKGYERLTGNPPSKTMKREMNAARKKATGFMDAQKNLRLNEYVNKGDFQEDEFDC